MSYSSGFNAPCWKALANFFQALESAKGPLGARWLHIIDGNESGSSNCSKIHNMFQCGLVHMGRKNKPIASIAKSKKNGSIFWMSS
jgi:hypothetical protein